MSLASLETILLFRRSIFCLAFPQFWRKSAENRLSKVNAIPSFNVNAMTSSIFFKQSSNEGKAESRPSKLGLMRLKLSFLVKLKLYITTIFKGKKNIPEKSERGSFPTFFLHPNTDAFSQSTIPTLITIIFADLAIFTEPTTIVLVLSDAPTEEAFTSIATYCAIMFPCRLVFTDLTIATSWI